MLPPDFRVIVGDVCTDFTAVKTGTEQIHPVQYDADFSISKLQNIFLSNIYYKVGNIIYMKYECKYITMLSHSS